MSKLFTPNIKKYAALAALAAFFSFFFFAFYFYYFSGHTFSDEPIANPAPLDFLEGLYAAGAKNSFNAVGYHPYTFPVPPSYDEASNAWRQMAATPKSIRSIMAANGDASKQIWLTEYGAPTGGPGLLATEKNYPIADSSGRADHVSEELQAIILVDAIRRHAEDSRVGLLFLHSYKDEETAPNTNENFFGIIRFNGSKKPAYSAIKQMVGNQRRRHTYEKI